MITNIIVILYFRKLYFWVFDALSGFWFPFAENLLVSGSLLRESSGFFLFFSSSVSRFPSHLEVICSKKISIVSSSKKKNVWTRKSIKTRTRKINPHRKIVKIDSCFAILSFRNLFLLVFTGRGWRLGYI